jgi:hypothetical protein
MECCSEKTGPMIFGHLAFLVGIFMLSWGFLSATTGAASWGGVFSSLFFWGLIVVGVGFCASHAGLKK